jgi:hypothetical protein
VTSHRSRRLLRRRHEEQGFVLVTTVLTFIVLILFSLVSLTYVLENATMSRRDQDGKLALAAAQAGLEDYLSHLNGDADYWRKGNDDPSNPAFSTAGRTMQSTVNPGTRYSYRVLTTPEDAARTGQVRIEITGRSSPGGGQPQAVRKLAVTFRAKTFLDFAYLSDVEVMDPELTGSDDACANYAYGDNSRDGLSCPQIVWKLGDRVRGPLHSNDALTIDSGAQFDSADTESSWPDIQDAAPGTKTWLGAASALPGNVPRYAAPIPLPDGNSEIAQYVTPNPLGGTNGPGCYYRGTTRIVFQGTTMRVYSPGTTSAQTPDRCLTVSNNAVEQVKAIPPVIYVDEGTADCPIGTVGYPTAGEAYTAGSYNDASWGESPNYDCKRGTAYVSGVVDGQVSVASWHDIVVTGDLTLADDGAGQDVVGLIAPNYVWVRHALDASGQNLTSSPEVQKIQAAILCLRHSFVAQNWENGAALGNLSLLGALAQKMRGPVGATDPTTGAVSGYLKDYQYDERFKGLQPPFFLKPGTNVWNILNVTDG